MEKRVSYDTGVLSEAFVAPDPFAQFTSWFQAAVDDGFREPGAMTLATASLDGRPSARVVLLRGYDERGFVFFTNYESRKGGELKANPRAALLFFWDRLERQIRIEGSVARLESPESDAYFAQRPRGHRLSAWASKQSAVIARRAVVEERMAHYDATFHDREVERPPYWGGYRLQPALFEFWQGRTNRIHDRLTYTRTQDAWRIERLAP